MIKQFRKWLCKKFGWHYFVYNNDKWGNDHFRCCRDCKFQETYSHLSNKWDKLTDIQNEWLSKLLPCECGSINIYHFLYRDCGIYYLGCKNEECDNVVSSEDPDGEGLKRCVAEWNEKFGKEIK